MRMCRPSLLRTPQTELWAGAGGTGAGPTPPAPGAGPTPPGTGTGPGPTPPGTGAGPGPPGAGPTPGSGPGGGGTGTVAVAGQKFVVEFGGGRGQMGRRLT